MYRKLSAILIPTLLAVYQVRDDLLNSLAYIVPAYLVIAVGICLAAWAIRGFRYSTILKSLTYRVGVLVSTACIFVSQTANLVVPARLGDFIRVFILNHEYQTTYSEGVSSVVVERVFDIVTVALLGAAALFFVFNVPTIYYWTILLPLVAGIVFFGFLLCIGKCSAKNKYIQIVLTMLHEIRRASLSIRSILVLGITSLFAWLFDILVCLAVALMFGQLIPFPVIVLAVVIGNLVKAVPITPGGIGIYEASLWAIFELAGVPHAIAALIAIIDHLIKNLVTFAGGIVSVYLFGDWVIPSIKAALNTKLNGGTRPES
jgi:uncharacterized protein (TIRG00374 family)